MGRLSPFHGGYPNPSSLDRCNGILAPSLQQTISLAARYAHDGVHGMAEKTRVYANYEGLDFRPDADQASGIV